MIVFLAIGTIAGILLGLRFKVFVLVPAILIATIVIIASGHELKVTALTVFGTVVALQIGYIAGCVLRVMARERVPTRNTAHLPTLQPTLQVETGHIEALDATLGDERRVRTRAG